MKWTYELPDKPGWYWHRWYRRGERIEEVIHVYELNLELTFQVIGEDNAWPISVLDGEGSEYAGPIPIPTE